MLLRLAARSSTRTSPARPAATSAAAGEANASTAAMASTAAQATARRLPTPTGAPKGALQGALSLDPSLYPLAPRDESAGDVLHGVFCPDPYRALEDPDAPSTASFVDAQNAVTARVLSSPAVADLRTPFKHLFEQLYDYPRFSTPFKRGDAYYYYHNSGLQPQSVLYRTLDPAAPHASSKAFLDPNTLSADGTVALRDVSFSDDGKLVAYSLSDGGSDWSVIKVMRAADDEAGGGKCGDHLPDVLRRVKFSSIAWTTDGLGFFYNRYDVDDGGDSDGKKGKSKAEGGENNGDSKKSDGKKESGSKDKFDGTEVDRLSGQRLYYHALGDPQSQDALVWEDKTQPEWMFGAETTDDGRYLALHVSEGCQPRNRLYVLDLAAHVKRRVAGGDGVNKQRQPYDFGAWPPRTLPFARVVDDFEGSYDVVANEGSTFTLRTNRKAPRYKVVKVDLKPALEAAAKEARDAQGLGGRGGASGGLASASTPPPSYASSATALTPADTWPEVIPEHAKDVLQGAVALKGDVVVARWLRDCVSGLELRALSSGALLRPLPLPSLGDVGAVSGTRKSNELFYSFTSFVEPGAVYRLGDASDASRSPALFRATKLSVPHDPSDYVTERLYATSKDGTRVPLFVTRHKSVQLDGSNPCLLYGYGGFSISLTAGFSASRLAWMRGFRGVFAQANLRGGGEFGTEWRDAGSVLNKQNVFDDFAACAEELISKRYSAPGKVAIQGGSNGGLLVAACANQRPDLFGAVIAQVGVMDMLRFHRATIGHAWQTDYGRPEENEAEFNVLASYSPLHNVALPQAGKGQYPAMILATGDHDDRVVPFHSLKLLATLQQVAAAVGEASPQKNPLVGRIETRAGHGAGKPTAKVIEETSDLFAFAAAAVGATWRDAGAAAAAE
jgi:prolyl oligopeptidase